MGIAITGEFEPSGGPGSFKLTLADDININGATAAGGGIVDGTDLLICDTGADGTTRSITVSQLPFLLDQTVGIADNNLVEIDSASVADNDYAKFTANGLEGRSYTEVKQDLDLEIGTDIQAWDAQLDSLALLTAAEVGYLDGTIAGTAVALKALVLDSSKNVATIGTLGCGVITQSGTTLDNTYHPVTTVGIANDNLVEIDDADAADNDYAKFTANGLEGRSYSEVKSDLSLSNVENTALSTWAGSSSITTVGTLSAGAVPAQLVTPGTGTFGTGSYTFDTDLTVGGDLTVGVNSLVVDAGTDAVTMVGNLTANSFRADAYEETIVSDLDVVAQRGQTSISLTLSGFFNSYVLGLTNPVFNDGTQNGQVIVIRVTDFGTGNTLTIKDDLANGKVVLQGDKTFVLLEDVLIIMWDERLSRWVEVFRNLGKGNDFSGVNSGWGLSNNFTGENSGWGNGNEFSGSNSGWGWTNTFSGRQSGWGRGNIANAYQAVFGRFATDQGHAIDWVVTDDLFKIGIGASTGARADAFRILKNGESYWETDQKHYYGLGNDVSMQFDSEDWIFNNEGITADAEVHFTNFTAYTFDNAVTMAGDLNVGSGMLVVDSGGGTVSITSITSPQLTIKYDATNSAAFSIESTGKLTIAATGVGANADIELSVDGFPNAIFIDKELQRIGIGSNQPKAKFHMHSDQNAAVELGLMSSYHIAATNPANDTGEEIGIAFGISTSLNAVGASITHERLGSASYGDLHFYTKPSSGGITRRMTIGSTGVVSIVNDLTVGGDIGFYGTAAVAQQVLATGAGATVDNVITALQNLGLVRQS